MHELNKLEALPGQGVGGESIQLTGDKLTKPPFFVAYSRLFRRCRNLAKGGCLSLRFWFTLCHYFMGHVACWNLPWQGLKLVCS